MVESYLPYINRNYASFDGCKRRQTLIIAFATIFSAWNTLMKETEIIWLAKSLWFIEARNSCIRNHPSSVGSKEKTSLDHCIKNQIFSCDSLLLFTTIVFNSSNRLHFPWVSLPIKLSCNVRRTWKKKLANTSLPALEFLAFSRVVLPYLVFFLFIIPVNLLKTFMRFIVYKCIAWLWHIFAPLRCTVVFTSSLIIV